MKIISCLLVAVLLFAAFTPVASFAGERGGLLGFIIGCCFGARSAAAYNDGKALHWLEWGLIIPFFGFVVAIINGVDGMNGMTSHDMAAEYGSNFY